MKSCEEYCEMVTFLKKENQINGWNALRVTAEELLSASDEDEKNLETVKTGMRWAMMTGDVIESEAPFTVVYYCDNLDPSRGFQFQAGNR